MSERARKRKREREYAIEREKNVPNLEASKRFVFISWFLLLLLLLLSLFYCIVCFVFLVPVSWCVLILAYFTRWRACLSPYFVQISRATKTYRQHDCAKCMCMRMCKRVLLCNCVDRPQIHSTLIQKNRDLRNNTLQRSRSKCKKVVYTKIAIVASAAATVDRQWR